MSYSKIFANEQHKKTILANGLRIVSLKKEDVASIAIEVLIKVGSRNEPCELNGLAHFLEHMNFKGTKNRTAKQIAEEFDAIGGFFNAYTSKETTVYTAKILKEYLPQAIDFISDIIFHSKYDENDIVKEKNVVLQEIGQSEDSPEEMVFEYFSEAAFKNQAIGRSILGTKDKVLQFNYQDIVNFIRKHYTPDKIIISAVGNLSHEELVNLVSEKFVPFSSAQVSLEAEAAVYTGGYKFEQDSKLSQIHIAIGYKGFSLHSDEYYKAEMLSGILGGGMSSRLFQEIREKHGLVYSISCSSNNVSDSGIFTINFSTSKDKFEQTLNLLSEEIKKITYNIVQEEIDRYLAQVKSSLHMSRETVNSLVGILASDYAFFDRYISEEETWEAFSLISIDDLHNLAKKVFSKESPITIAIVGDVENIPSYEAMQGILTI